MVQCKVVQTKPKTAQYKPKSLVKGSFWNTHKTFPWPWHSRDKPENPSLKKLLGTYTNHSPLLGKEICAGMLRQTWNLSVLTVILICLRHGMLPHSHVQPIQCSIYYNKSIYAARPSDVNISTAGCRCLPECLKKPSENLSIPKLGQSHIAFPKGLL